MILKEREKNLRITRQKRWFSFCYPCSLPNMILDIHRVLVAELNGTLCPDPLVGLLLVVGLDVEHHVPAVFRAVRTRLQNGRGEIIIK